MSRANNTARSLGIISRANGWNPDVIVDQGSDGPVGAPEHNVADVWFAREDIHASDTPSSIPASVNNAATKDPGSFGVPIPDEGIAYHEPSPPAFTPWHSGPPKSELTRATPGKGRE